MAAASATKISWRLQEFEAQSSAVSCVCLGKNSGRLLATGGDDCKVNIWSVSKPNCIMSLRGHTNPVECVQFNSSEEQIVAGSQSGSLRLWDMEAAKILRTLMGHKANITSLGFHPFGEYLASGSMDTHIRIWDVRRKGCVFKYKGHTQAVRSLAFSPDGKWLASASDDGTVKLWDLLKGKVITEFTAHTAGVNIVQFHPNEYLLASGSSDRTIKLWDLEKFSMIASMEGETNPVKCILFSPDGGCLYSGATDSLKVYGWEPVRRFSVVQVDWNRVSDMAVCNQQLIAVSHQLSTVASYVVDLKRVKRSGGVQDDKPQADPSPKASTLRRSYERPATTCSGQRVKQSLGVERRSPEGERRSPSSEDEKEDKESAAEICHPEDYNAIFQPKNAISRSPPRVAEPFPAPPEDVSHPKDVAPPLPDTRQAPLASSTPVQRVEPTVISSPQRAPPQISTFETPASNPAPLPPLPQIPPPAANTKSKPQNANIILATRNEPIGLNVADFLPAVANSRQPQSSEDALSQIKKGHDTMWVMLSSRLKNLERVRTAWGAGDVKNSLDIAVSINDPPTVVDLLNILNMKPSLWKLDLCTSILPQIEALLRSKYESYVQTGCMSLKLILTRFWPLISDTLKAPPSVGVDITREERHEKCVMCYKLLKNLNNVVKNKAQQVGRHGSTFRELQLLMAPLD